ncbi:hypothetical protein N752_09730 [Desulforamulus aquiferis]|nr:hypothetical protein [Desulforamulus aquiferis]RYD05367.1 hypothetical protein N752_09730 [Desulforamulus aquiferis]
MKRLLKILCLLVLLTFTLTSSAAAYSINSISRIVSISNNNQYYSVGEIRFSEDKDFNNDFKNGDIFTIALPQGVSWNPETVVNATYADVKLVSDRVLEIKMKNCTDGVTDTIVLTGLQIKVGKEFTGDIKLEIDGKDSGITSSISSSTDNSIKTNVQKYENEIVTVLKVFDQFSALIARENGEQYIVETDVPLGLWSLQKKPVIILSPGSFLPGLVRTFRCPVGTKVSL